ncbi:MAG: hypothetical protein SOR91_04040 [Hornefia butyriciproducens]|jgi:hypothetical protein|uniref:hypothetical protein n=1 Tax=Hornefia butyriciproducens TaxID=2652293 RepID=UPI002A74C09B|nr:hypothetical protein [Hornefia butyriciproducens]MDY2990627.1 hypothetical protein [Hornefia butyriciproducens]
MKRKQIRSRETNNRLFDAVYEDGDKVSIEVKLGRNKPTEKIDLADVLKQIEEGKLEPETIIYK